MDAAVDHERMPERTPSDLRRESRRKKILESAKSRLERLNGRPKAVVTNHTDAAEALEYSDPEVEPNIPVRTPKFQEEIFNCPLFATTNLAATNPDVPNIFVKSRAHIFIASVLGYILSHYVNNSLFVPIGLCLIFELFYYKGQQYNNSNLVNLILPVALLFTGASLGNKIKQISVLLAITQSLIINLAVNIFCICICSFLFQYISINHVVDLK